MTTSEHQRLSSYKAREGNWKKWGPYLSERAWGTVREDYSREGDAWNFFSHDQSRSRVYRWNEDGLFGWSDRDQNFCFAIALWNGQDTILKERLFGLTGKQCKYGEDVKEYYYYLDGTPSHSYMKALYKYPQGKFPYEQLLERNAGNITKEYELLDTGIFNEDRYFDVFIEYAKEDQEDIFIKIEIINRGPEAAECYLLPTFWFRNIWSWGYEQGPMNEMTGCKPRMTQVDGHSGVSTVKAEHCKGGTYYFYADETPELLFTENETNQKRLFDTPNVSPYVKDAFHRYIINQETDAVNPEHMGTKSAALYKKVIPSGKSALFRLRISKKLLDKPFEKFEKIIQERHQDADEFYAALQPPNLSTEQKQVQRQALAGMLWNKQLYYYDIVQWLEGDAGNPIPPEERKFGRNALWEHLFNFDLISMPDKWEYPWYANWDLAFHAIPLALVDPEFAKRQLVLLTREWYMHPNGQLPAYEWNLSDVNPPVHAWATWRVYQIDAKMSDKPDRDFLKGIFHKLLLNFTWWVNRKDSLGNNIFQGGFLGMDNISIFDRSSSLPMGGYIDQADGTAWMGFYCVLMMKMALELAKEEPIYQDSATKFFEHFLRIATAMVKRGGHNISLWDDEDGFFYDTLHLPDQGISRLRVRSLVGLLPLFAVETLDSELLNSMPVFKQRMQWFISKRPQYTTTMSCVETPGIGSRHLMAIMTEEHLRSVLRYMLDENEFLSPYGIRSLSKHYQDHPYSYNVGGRDYTINYEPAESQSGIYGGNSNWRGPIWMPINYLIIESLQKYHRYYGDDLKVEFPTGSGNLMNLNDVATELSKRLIKLFLKDHKGHRPINGQTAVLQEDPHWRDNILFHEYFHADTGEGLGASHQTGWTGLVAKLIQQSGSKF